MSAARIIPLVAAVAAATVYFANPQRGAIRRANFRDRVHAAVHGGEERVREVFDVVKSQFDAESQGLQTPLPPVSQYLAGTLGSALIALALLKGRTAFPAAVFGASLLARAVTRESSDATPSKALSA